MLDFRITSHLAKGRVTSLNFEAAWSSGLVIQSCECLLSMCKAHTPSHFSQCHGGLTMTCSAQVVHRLAWGLGGYSRGSLGLFRRKLVRVPQSLIFDGLGELCALVKVEIDVLTGETQV